MRWIIAGIILSYLAGSIPTAYIFGRVLKGIDIRRFGSGNVGATNALRVLGKTPGIIVLILDILKGLIAVALLGNVLAPKSAPLTKEALLIILGVSCIIGHNWTIFLGFKGGKGIATTLGVLLALSLEFPGLKIIVGLLILTWGLAFAVTRIVSIASVLTGLAFPLYAILFKQSLFLILCSVLLCLFILLRHKSNLKRFFLGKEPRITFKKSR